MARTAACALVLLVAAVALVAGAAAQAGLLQCSDRESCDPSTTVQTQGALKDRIKLHYDMLSPYYKALWGNDIHHGYWITGDESKEQAATQLIEELARRGKMFKGAKVLDVGCGVGGTSVYLAKTWEAQVTGISLSPVQVAMAKRYAEESGVGGRTEFFEMDAENITLPGEGTYDFVWTSEVLSHLSRRPVFWAHAARMLKPGGKWVCADWFKAPHLSAAQFEQYIVPIETGMLLPPVDSLEGYIQKVTDAGLRLLWSEDISEQVRKTWDISLELVSNPSLWSLAWQHGSDWLEFLRAFQAMRTGYSTRTFVYGTIVMEKAGAPRIE